MKGIYKVYKEITNNKMQRKINVKFSTKLWNNFAIYNPNKSEIRYNKDMLANVDNIETAVAYCVNCIERGVLKIEV